jgi:hypothetical protein
LSEDVKNDSPSRISISEEKLRAALSDLKLELVREFGNYAPREALELAERRLTELVSNLSARVLQLELWRATQQGAETTKARLSGSQLAWASIAASLFGSVVGALASHFLFHK